MSTHRVNKKSNLETNIPMLPSMVVFGVPTQYPLTELKFTGRVSGPLHNDTPVMPAIVCAITSLLMKFLNF